MTAKESYALWLEKVQDESLLTLMRKMDDVAVENAFYKELEFGTGGLRGEIGAGTNCLNIYTIRKVTCGIAMYMKDKKMESASISYDSRINSDLFARCAAEVLGSQGFTVQIVKELMPTPFLSYMTRSLKSDIGIMITASHNPSKYNGYKVYGSDGCQLTDIAAEEMTGYIAKVDPFKVEVAIFDALVKEGKIRYISDNLIEDYLTEVRKQSQNSASGLKVVYTPLNGTGYKLIPEILKRAGVTDITSVEEQSYPDGNFTTCNYPNPEKPEALKLGLECALKNEADILIATDPDADRMGVAVLHNGEYRLMTGNEMGVLLTDFLLQSKKDKGTLPARPVIVKTIVSTNLAERVAAQYNAEFYDVLTGFKYIGDVIGKLEAKGESERFVLGFEESYGYLSGTYVRDKDAVVASMLTAEMTAAYKKQGMTLIDRIEALYIKFGDYEHKLISFEFAGSTGNAKMKQLIGQLRDTRLDDIGGLKVVKKIDYLSQTESDLPPANVLSFNLEGGSQLIVRPSGTEPLIKMYLTACKTKDENKTIFAAMTKFVNNFFK